MTYNGSDTVPAWVQTKLETLSSDLDKSRSDLKNSRHQRDLLHQQLTSVQLKLKRKNDDVQSTHRSLLNESEKRNSLETEIESLLREMKKREEKLCLIEGQLERSEREVSEEREKKTHAHRELESSQQRESNLRVELELCSKQKEFQESKLGHLLEEKEKSSVRCIQLERQIAEQKAKNERAQSQIVRIRTDASLELERLRVQMGTKIDEAREEGRSDRDRLISEIAEVRKENENVRNRGEDLQKELQLRSIEVQQLKNKVNETSFRLVSEGTESQGVIADVQRDAKGKIAAIQEDLARVKATAARNLSEKSAQLDSKVAEVAALQERVVQLEREKVELVGVTQQRAETATEAVRIAKTNVEELKREALERSREIDELKNQLEAEKESARREIGIVKEREAHLEEDKKRAFDQADQLRGKLRIMEAVMAEKESSRDRDVTSTETRLRDAVREREEAKVELTSVRRELETLRSDLESKQAEIEKARANLSSFESDREAEKTELNEEIFRLKKGAVETRISTKALEMENVELERKLKAYYSQEFNAELVLSGKEAEVTHLKSQVFELERKLQSQKESSQAQSVSFKTAIDDLNEKIQEVEALNIVLNEQKVEFDVHARDLRSQVTLLKQEAVSQKQENKSLVSEKESLASQVEAANDLIASLRADAGRQESQIGLLTVSETRLKNQVAESDKELQEMLSRLSASEAALSSVEKSLRESNDSLLSVLRRVEEKDSALGTIRSKLSSSVVEVESLSTTIAELRSEGEKLKQRIVLIASEKEALELSLRDERTALGLAKKTIEELQIESSRKAGVAEIDHSKQGALEIQVMDLNVALSKAQDEGISHKNALLKAQRQLQEKDTFLEGLRKEKSRYESFIEILKKTHAKISSKSQQAEAGLADAQSKIAKLEVELASSCDECRSLKQTICELRAERVDKETEAGQLERESQRHANELQDSVLTQVVDEQKNRGLIERKTLELQQISDDLQKSRDESAQLRRDLARARIEISNCRREKEQLAARFKLLSEEKGHLTSQFAERVGDSSALEAQKSAQDAELNALRDDLATAEAHVVGLKADLVVAGERFDSKVSEFLRLEDEFALYKAQNMSATDALQSTSKELDLSRTELQKKSELLDSLHARMRSNEESVLAAQSAKSSAELRLSRMEEENTRTSSRIRALEAYILRKDRESGLTEGAPNEGSSESVRVDYLEGLLNRRQRLVEREKRERDRLESEVLRRREECSEQKKTIRKLQHMLRNSDELQSPRTRTRLDADVDAAASVEGEREVPSTLDLLEGLSAPPSDFPTPRASVARETMLAPPTPMLPRPVVPGGRGASASGVEDEELEDGDSSEFMTGQKRSRSGSEERSGEPSPKKRKLD